MRFSKESSCNTGVLGLIPGSGRSPGEGYGNPFQYSCWRIPRTEELGGLQFMGLQRVGHDWATNTFTLSVTNVVEHLYLLAVHVSSLVKCHFSSFAHLLIGLFIFLFNCEAICTHICTYIYKNRHMLVIPPLWDIRFTNIFFSTFSFS